MNRHLVVDNTSVHVPDDIYVHGEMLLIDNGLAPKDFIELYGETVLTGTVVTLPLDAHFDRVYVFNDSVLHVEGSITCMSYSTVGEEDLVNRNRHTLNEIMKAARERLSHYEEELMQIACHPKRLLQI